MASALASTSQSTLRHFTNSFLGHANSDQVLDRIRIANRKRKQSNSLDMSRGWEAYDNTSAMSIGDGTQEALEMLDVEKISQLRNESLQRLRSAWEDIISRYADGSTGAEWEQLGLEEMKNDALTMLKAFLLQRRALGAHSLVENGNENDKVEDAVQQLFAYLSADTTTQKSGHEGIREGRDEAWRDNGRYLHDPEVDDDDDDVIDFGRANWEVAILDVPADMTRRHEEENPVSKVIKRRRVEEERVHKSTPTAASVIMPVAPPIIPRFASPAASSAGPSVTTSDIPPTDPSIAAPNVAPAARSFATPNVPAAATSITTSNVPRAATSIARPNAPPAARSIAPPVAAAVTPIQSIVQFMHKSRKPSRSIEKKREKRQMPGTNLNLACQGRGACTKSICLHCGGISSIANSFRTHLV